MHMLTPVTFSLSLVVRNLHAEMHTQTHNYQEDTSKMGKIF